MSVYVLLESGHPAKVAECQLTLSEVLDHPRNTLHGTVEVVTSRDTDHQLPSDIHNGLPVSDLFFFLNVNACKFCLYSIEAMSCCRV